MQDIQQETVSATVFDPAHKVVFSMLRYSVFPLWKQSPSFHRALEACKIKDLSELPLKSKKKDYLTQRFIELARPSFEGHV